LPLVRLNTTVVGSGASTPARLASSAAGPFGSLMATIRSNVNFTSDEVSSWPLAKVRPGFRVTVYWVGEVNSADWAMSGSTSGLP
jgi:hypothetical protein